jgi:hypothetical protein
MKFAAEDLSRLDNQVREIGKYLGMDFDQDYVDRQERDWNYSSELKSGPKRISFRASDYKAQDRFVIRGEFPKDKKGQIHRAEYNLKWPEITVAIDRGAEKIAKAIKSRLMPEYEKQLPVVLEMIQKSDAYHAGRLQVLQTVADYFGQPRPEEDDKAIYPGPEVSRKIYKIEPGSDGGVKFDVNTSVEKALTIFDILKQETL